MIPYPITDLKDSIFGRAAMGGKVVNIPDLDDDHLIQGDQDLLERGVRSLLLIPLVSRSGWWGESPNHMIGLVGLTSTQPYAFSRADVNQARALIPALTAALRPGVQNRFTNIHPSVRWRFEQEAERRSWGLPPRPHPV
ncbi:MAG: GAF domain-containing protein [Leptolyngbyaceae cyanobacterium SM2_3_12]|nr:GAF domain-containing protein [Leptolyngbyaceae cyanobacterium SM2_3_12]